MPAITIERMHQFAPNAHPDIVAGLLLFNADDILISGGITSALILQHFLGQCYVECDAFETLSENLHYTAARLRVVFPRYFKTIAAAQAVAGNPIATADIVYGNRMGNTDPHDGYNFRGGGYLDMTGKSNYSRIARLTGIDLVNHPDMVRDPQTALHIAVLMWQALGCNDPASRDDGVTVTQRVNGGQNGAADRAAATDRAAQIFTYNPASSNAPVGFMDLPPNPSKASHGALMVGGPVPMSTTQAMLIQQQLKDKSYAPGEIDGNIHGPSTVGSIAELQSQQGLPVTGEVDDATEDAIQDAPPKIVSADRAAENAASLRAKGSDTIKATDDAKAATHGVVATAASALAVGSGSLLSGINDQANQLQQVTDHIPGLSNKFSAFVTGHWQLFVLLVFGGLLLYFSKNIYASADKIIAERVRKSASGEDMSH